MLQNLKQAGSMMANAGKIKQQQEKLQKLLASIRVTGQSKNGKVTVIITGEQKIVDINIDPSLISFVYENFFKPAGEETNTEKAAEMRQKGQKFMASSIIEAVEDAISKVQGEVVKKMQETGSLGDLMSMLQAASGGGM